MSVGVVFICVSRIGFAFATLHDWFTEKVAPIFFIQSEIKPNPIVISFHSFSRAPYHVYVITSRFDWLIV